MYGGAVELTGRLMAKPVAGRKGGATQAKEKGAQAPKHKARSSEPTSPPLHWRLLPLLIVALPVAAYLCAKLAPGPSRLKGPLPRGTIWAASDAVIPGGKALQGNVTCQGRASGSGSCNAPRDAGHCARFVLDAAVAHQDALELRRMVDWLIGEAWGAGTGPPSVVDLHQGTISYKEQFVDLEALMEFKSINFTQAHVDAYAAVRRTLRATVARLFGVPEDDLMFDLGFFSHINASKEPKTLHDEYWHSHIDTVQYRTFAYTTLLYLSTEGDDFAGGEFIFEETKSSAPALAVEPRFNRLVVFTSNEENPHLVEKVTDGIRITLTTAFTCDAGKAASIMPFPRP